MQYRSLLGFAAAAVVLVLFIWLIGTGDVYAAVLTVDPWLFSWGFLFVILSLVFRSVVWVRFLRMARVSASVPRIGILFLSAMFIKYVTPYGQVTAEPFIAYIVAEDGAMDYEEGLASIATADLFNYVPYYTFGLVGFIYLVFVGALDATIVGYLAAITGLVLAVLLFVVAVFYKRTWTERAVVAVAGILVAGIGRFSDRIARRFAPDRVQTRLVGFYETIDRFANNRWEIGVATVYAHLGMAFLLLPVYSTALAAGTHIPFLLIALIIAISKLGALFPAPGGLGGIEITIVAAMYLVTPIDLATATVIALLYRLCTYWFTVGIGGLATVYLSIR